MLILVELQEGYKAITISTIVDRVLVMVLETGYKAITISTIVDISGGKTCFASAIRP